MRVAPRSTYGDPPAALIAAALLAWSCEPHGSTMLDDVREPRLRDGERRRENDRPRLVRNANERGALSKGERILGGVFRADTGYGYDGLLIEAESGDENHGLSFPLLWKHCA